MYVQEWGDMAIAVEVATISLHRNFKELANGIRLSEAQMERVKNVVEKNGIKSFDYQKLNSNFLFLFEGDSHFVHAKRGKELFPTLKIFSEICAIVSSDNAQLKPKL